MKKEYFTSTWLALREPYDFLSRNKNLKKLIRKSDCILDIGSGTGGFGRWCIENDIFFKTMMLLDHDQRLLNNSRIYTAKFCKSKKLVIERISKRKFKVEDPVHNLTYGFETINRDLGLTIDLINNFDVLSMSALIDLLSIKYLSNLFNIINGNKVIAMTLCFNGKVSWNHKNIHDKYIVNEFNKDQQSIKEGELALGYKSIEKVKQLSKKKNFKISIHDSSWKLLSNSHENKKFHMKYLETIYKPLKRNDQVDNEMLEKWFSSKIKLIDNNSLETTVGHNDIIIQT